MSSGSCGARQRRPQPATRQQCRMQTCAPTELHLCITSAAHPVQRTLAHRLCCSDTKSRAAEVGMRGCRAGEAKCRALAADCNSKLRCSHWLAADCSSKLRCSHWFAESAGRPAAREPGRRRAGHPKPQPWG